MRALLSAIIVTVISGGAIVFAVHAAKANVAHERATERVVAELVNFKGDRPATLGEFSKLCGFPGDVTNLGKDIVWHYPKHGLSVTFTKRDARDEYRIGYWQYGTSHPIDPATAIRDLECGAN
jgi:hypothetical protein